MIHCPICDASCSDETFKAHLEETHTYELIQRLQNRDDPVIRLILATGLGLGVSGGLIKDLTISGEVWHDARK